MILFLMMIALSSLNAVSMQFISLHLICRCVVSLSFLTGDASRSFITPDRGCTSRSRVFVPQNKENTHLTVVDKLMVSLSKQIILRVFGSIVSRLLVYRTKTNQVVVVQARFIHCSTRLKLNTCQDK